MRIVTNPGSNLSAEMIEHYDVVMSPQRITVDGVHHDTLGEIALDDIDRWCATAKKWPFVTGSQASDMIQLFQELLGSGDETELLNIQTSKKLIQSHTAATVAARTYLESSKHPGQRIEVFDSAGTDVMAALSCIMAGEAQRAGLNLDEILAQLEAFRKGAEMITSAQSMDTSSKEAVLEH